jgi:hypothetical protein
MSWGGVQSFLGDVGTRASKVNALGLFQGLLVHPWSTPRSGRRLATGLESRLDPYGGMRALIPKVFEHLGGTLGWRMSSLEGLLTLPPLEMAIILHPDPAIACL